MPTKDVTTSGLILNPLGTLNVDIDDAIGTFVIGHARRTLNATSTPKATQAMFSPSVQLTAGAYTLDLNAGPDSVSLNNLYIRFWAFWIPSSQTNSALIRFDVGASNGINFGGASTNDMSLLPGGLICSYLSTGGPQVLSASAKTIDVTSSDTDAIFACLIVAGTA